MKITALPWFSLYSVLFRTYLYLLDKEKRLAHCIINLSFNLLHLQVEECIGAAVIAMGPDKILSLVPIAFDEDRLTCSNTWLLPILDKYIYGASLQQFLEYIVPLAKSVQNASNKGKYK